MAGARKLKVYAAPVGFHEAVVAAPNQKAALQAWGARENWFAHGDAREVHDPAAVEAALASPGVVLKRPVGSDAQLLAAARPAAANEAAPKPAGAKAARAALRAAKPRPPRDRAALDAAERALKAAERERQALERDQAHEREALDRAQAQAREASDAGLARLRDACAAARRAFDAQS